MKIHYAEFENYGDYESPCWGTEETLCGYTGEIPCENATNIWKNVTCKKCIKLKEGHEKNRAENEKIIVQQMGEMAEFCKKEV